MKPKTTKKMTWSFQPEYDMDLKLSNLDNETIIHIKKKLDFQRGILYWSKWYENSYSSQTLF
jgi:hypothetical protein